jgi:transcription elongation factor Elf1
MGGNILSVSDFNAEKKWRSLPKDLQKKLISNVFCRSCGETTIVDYSVLDEKFGIVLKGCCKECGGQVARYVED